MDVQPQRDGEVAALATAAHNGPRQRDTRNKAILHKAPTVFDEK